MLIDELKKANIEAMKAKNTTARGILSVVINKYMTVSINNREKGVETTDAEVVAILQKAIKEIDEEKQCFVQTNELDRVAVLEEQKNILEKFLPSMLNSDEIRGIIMGLSDRSLPSVMKHFKTNYAGQCDMQLVNKLARECQG